MEPPRHPIDSFQNRAISECIHELYTLIAEESYERNKNKSTSAMIANLNYLTLQVIEILTRQTIQGLEFALDEDFKKRMRENNKGHV